MTDSISGDVTESKILNKIDLNMFSAVADPVHGRGVVCVCVCVCVWVGGGRGGRVRPPRTGQNYFTFIRKFENITWRAHDIYTTSHL